MAAKKKPTTSKKKKAPAVDPALMMAAMGGGPGGPGGMPGGLGFGEASPDSPAMLQSMGSVPLTAKTMVQIAHRLAQRRLASQLMAGGGGGF